MYRAPKLSKFKKQNGITIIIMQMQVQTLLVFCIILLSQFMGASKKILNYLIFCSLLVSATSFYNQYCGSNCLDYLGTCFSTGYNATECVVCAISIYKQDPDPVTNACILKNQTKILTVDLQAPISLNGFSSSTLVPFTCGPWLLSGKYTGGSYLSKVYQTPGAHYMVVLRYNLLYMGNSWSTADTMTVSVDENVTTFGYKCSYPTALCTTMDCPKIGEIKAGHNSTNATVKFTSSIVASSGSSWGVSNLIVALLTCHVSCNTCFGASPHQCLSCTNNSFLLGNTCVKKCPIMTIPNLNLCTPACPGGFYPVTTTSICSPCSQGCSVCTGPLESNCILNSIQPSLWEQQKQFWIFLIIIASIIILVALVFLYLKRRREKVAASLKEPIINETKCPTEMDMDNMRDMQKSQGFMNDEVHVNESQSSSSNSNQSDDGPKAVKIKRKWKGKE